MKSILVTGGAGFIGSHTCLELLRKGLNLYVLDSFVNSKRSSLSAVLKILKINNIDAKNRIKIIEGDIRDKDLLKSIFFSSIDNGKPINSIIHFAGLKSVADSVLDPISNWDSNFIGALNLISTMLQFECYCIVFSSSATIYGLSNQSPIKEDCLINPINPYGNSKYAIEKLLHDVFKSSKNKLRVANLRYFNPVGAHPSGLIGEDPLDKPNNIFPIITKVAIGKKKKLQIFGNDWPTVDGTGVRDYIHVMDLADAHLKALKHLTGSENKHIILNVGTGKGTSVLELINTFQEANKVNINYTFAKRRKGDMPEVFADPTLALNTLNWSAKRELKEMCIDGWNWQKKNPLGYKLN